MLTDEQRSELEERGAENVRAKLTSYGGGPGILHGFLRSGSPNRGDVEDWLTEKSRSEAAWRSATLRWARIAGWAAIAATILAAVALAVQIWPATRNVP
jgi:hypothetical protein